MFSILLLSEDTSSQAPEVLRRLVAAALRLIDPEARPERGRFSPADDPQVRSAIRANRWKSTSPNDYNSNVVLFRTVATELLTEDGFVVWHVDGDCAWDRRASGENRQKFEQIAFRGVRSFVASTLAKQGRSDELDDCMARLFLFLPHYSIEAWLYQATRAAAAVCRDRQCGRHVALVEAWGSDRARLDEVVRPKDATCFGSGSNAALAGAFPASEVNAVGKSFHNAVGSLRASAALTAALVATRRRA